MSVVHARYWTHRGRRSCSEPTIRRSSRRLFAVLVAVAVALALGSGVATATTASATPTANRLFWIADPGAGNQLQLPRHAAAQALKGHRDVFFPDGGLLRTAVYDRYALPPGATVNGPAVFEEDESTFILGPNSTARVLEDGSILAEAN